MGDEGRRAAADGGQGDRGGQAHDKDAVLNVGEEIDNACESCHKVYGYPDEKIPSVPASEAPASKS